MALIKNERLLRWYLDLSTKLNAGPPKTSRFEVKSLTFEGRTIAGTQVLMDGINATKILLYLHGGGYIFGSSQVYKGMVSRIAKQLQCPAFIPDYALAPENPFPAGIIDVIACYQALLSQGYSGEDIILMGDSAGGNFTLGLLHHLLENKIDLPRCAVVFAAQTDFTMASETLASNARTENVLAASRFEELRDTYLQGADVNAPLASPIFGEFTDAPPIQIQVAKREILYGDNLSMARKLRDQGVSVDFHEYDHSFHVFQILAGKVPEADAALDTAAAFVLKHLDNQSET